MKHKTLIWILAALMITACQSSKKQRNEISLNGHWEITETLEGEKIPDRFDRTIPVPGIVSMAVPSFDSTGTRFSGRNYYWYRKAFTLNEDEIGAVVLLKVNKAKYGTKVFVNGQDAGFNPWCLTPSYFNIADHLKPGQENELVIRLGATEFDIPDSIPNDRTDLEKNWHFAGLYDDVKLIVSDFPFIENVQIVPDIENEKLRVVAEIKSDLPIDNFSLDYVVSTAKLEEVVIKGGTSKTAILADKTNRIDFEVPMKDCRLWSPEDPFLYSLKLSTGSDTKTQRFGMRSFTFDPEKGMALLNGKPYPMLGTNVTIFRFFEDENRGQLPWDKDWVRDLHLSFKEMNWNSIRYSIGFPPEIWYDIADETGFLIQDEYLYWYQYGVFAPSLIADFENWMRERWNHPSVVIWDAQNETVSTESGKAIRAVRHLDLSDRPWDNWFSPPVRDTDPIESHPYLFYEYTRGKKPSPDGYLVDFFAKERDPHNDPNEHAPVPDGSRFENAVIINEYDWLWINRDGSPTTLTDQVYATVWGEDLTAEERFEIRAENVAILTEFWRCHRKCAAIMHFCGLGYSRPEEPRGQTSDIFLDVENLVIDPLLLQYVKPKFARVCNMIDLWHTSYKANSKVDAPVYAINDFETEWTGDVSLNLYEGEQLIAAQSQPATIKPFGRKILEFDVTMPSSQGEYKLISEIILEKDTVRSIRKFNIQ
ncbi:MAG: hypothetical protein KI790_02445 [Cyclobacteriaceae bacterium]|nr:hypothetical protein [Cyclobacteriaceae bacterium HetDA_MAG_MS6]